MKVNISGVLLRGMPLEYKDNTDPTSNVKSGGGTGITIVLL